MAAKEIVWNVTVDEVPYKVRLMKNCISVNGGAYVKYTKLQKAVGQGKGAKYLVPLGNQNAVLHVSSFGGVALTLDGKDCMTGQPYEEPKLPWWIWIHVVIHAAGFFLLVGGAVGGAIQAGVICTMLGIASDNKKSNSFKIGVCTAMLVVSLIVQFALALLVFSLFG